MTSTSRDGVRTKDEPFKFSGRSTSLAEDDSFPSPEADMLVKENEKTIEYDTRSKENGQGNKEHMYQYMTYISIHRGI